MLTCIFILLEPRLNTSGCVYGRIVILKNCIIGRKYHPYCRMHLVTKHVQIASGSNWTIPSNYRAGRIPRYCCPNDHRPPPCFTIGSGSQDFRLPWALSRRKPALMFGTASHLTILRISNHQTSRLYDHHTIFCLLVLFSVIRGLAVAPLPWIGFVKLLSDCFPHPPSETGSSRRLLSTGVTLVAVL